MHGGNDSAEASSSGARILSVAVLDDYNGFAKALGPWERLHNVVDVSFIEARLGDPSDVVSALAEYDVVVAMRERTAFPREVLLQLPRLRLLVTTGAVNDVIDLATARELGLVVSGTRTRGGTPTVELTWALILALTRHLPAINRLIRHGGWDHESLGIELEGKNLGVVGLGRLGTQVARIGHAFGMNVIAWSSNLDQIAAGAVDVSAVSKEELFATADVVTIHLKLSERTRATVGRAEFERMKPTAFLINTSRGPIVDEAALIDALDSGAIRGAGLDVFDEEPLPPAHRLRTLDNVVLTPHVGHVTDGTYRVYFEDVVENIELFITGRPTRRLA